MRAVVKYVCFVSLWLFSVCMCVFGSGSMLYFMRVCVHEPVLLFMLGCAFLVVIVVCNGACVLTFISVSGIPGLCICMYVWVYVCVLV